MKLIKLKNDEFNMQEGHGNGAAYGSGYIFIGVGNGSGNGYDNGEIINYKINQLNITGEVKHEQKDRDRSTGARTQANAGVIESIIGHT